MCKKKALESEQRVLKAMEACFEVSSDGNLCGCIALTELMKITKLARQAVINVICRLIVKGKLVKHQDIDENGCFLKNYYEILSLDIN